MKHSTRLLAALVAAAVTVSGISFTSYANEVETEDTLSAERYDYSTSKRIFNNIKLMTDETFENEYSMSKYLCDKHSTNYFYLSWERQTFREGYAVVIYNEAGEEVANYKDEFNYVGNTDPLTTNPFNAIEDSLKEPTNVTIQWDASELPTGKYTADLHYFYLSGTELKESDTIKVVTISLRDSFEHSDDLDMTYREAFVTRMYNVGLGRDPEPQGLNYWANRLAWGMDDAVDIVHGILCSPEYLDKGKTNGEIVTDCYHAMLDRDPDEGGYNDWVEKLDAGMTVNAIFAGFVGSDEFCNMCWNQYDISPGTYELTDPRDQNFGVTSYVARLYTQALGREYDPAGLSDWCGRIIENPDRDNIIDVAATGFFHSEEFQNKGLSNEEYVKVLYRTFLGREAEEAGLNSWVEKLDSGENTRDEILPGFAYSQEFTNIMAEYGL